MITSFPLTAVSPWTCTVRCAPRLPGTRHISGTGGQLDFVTGALKAKNGLAFLAMPSSRVDKKTGVRHSNILPKFTQGDVITTPRTQAPHMVTEYGVARLPGLATWQRAEAIINIAHPDCGRT